MGEADAIEEIRSNLPCSVELPAGCGKTETIVRLVERAAEDGHRSLVLTHTHAGIDAIKRRLRKLGVAGGLVTVSTLDSWCFALVSRFPQLSGVVVGEEPDWAESQQYHEGGAAAVDTDAIRRMLVASYELLVVDEYQDCQKWQHALVAGIARSLPAAVFGDRMQGLFFFGDSNDSVSWESDVLPVFPAVDVEITPWRWKDHNPQLGDWLIDARNKLMSGEGIDIASSPITRHTLDELVLACGNQPSHPMRVAVIAKQDFLCASMAPRLFSYSMIEEVEGRFLIAFAETIDTGSPSEIAAATVTFAVKCATGVARPFDSASRKQLAKGKKLTGVRFEPFPDQRALVDSLLVDSSPKAVLAALRSLASLNKFRLFRREAWFGVLDALSASQMTEELTVREAVVQHRARLRLAGRYPESRVLARPLLIKGLEFDYAVVTGLENYDAHELYVCLTRGSRGVTVISNDTVFSPARPG